MPLIPIIILLFIVFFGIIFFLKYFLTSNINKATSQMDALAGECAIKEAEINRRLKEAAEEAAKTLAEARREAEEQKNKVMKEAFAAKDAIIVEARHKGEDMLTQTEKTCAILRREIEDRIEKGAMDKACDLLYNALPEEFRLQLHGLWMDEIEKGDFHLGRLAVPENVDEIKIVSAFALTEKQKRILNDKLVAKFGKNIRITAEVDAKLTAGLTIYVGHAVIDGSLRNRIDRQVQRVQ